MKALLITLWIPLAACGGDFCSKAEAFDATAKLGTCNGSEKIVLGNVGYTQQSCENNLKSCSAQDVSALNAAMDCLDALPTCVAGNETGYTAQVLNCDADLKNSTYTLSSTCNGAFVGFPIP